MSIADAMVLFRTPARLPRRKVKAFARELRDQVSGGRGFTCLVTDDDELRKLNNTFLRNDYATDVLSFPEPGDESMGEIAISVERAVEQAAEHGHTLGQEIEVLMLHGVLHLLGMDHEKDTGQMARAESRWRKKLDLPSGLIARSRR
ncbi:MAG: rRNA maturation RNase YbeY [Bryobacteraceae bacterium]